MIQPNERFAVLIDGASTRLTAIALGFDIDYKRLLEHFAQQGRLLRPYYFLAMQEDGDDPVHKVSDWLDYNGYTLMTRPAIKVKSPEGATRWVRPSLSVDMAVTAMDLVVTGAIDHALIFSGNGDLVPAVEWVQRRGCRVTVVSSIKTSPHSITDDLRRQADTFVDLIDLQADIASHKKVAVK